MFIEEVGETLSDGIAFHGLQKYLPELKLDQVDFENTFLAACSLPATKIISTRPEFVELLVRIEERSPNSLTSICEFFQKINHKVNVSRAGLKQDFLLNSILYIN